MKSIYTLLFALVCILHAKAQNTYQVLYGNTNTFFANGSSVFATVQTDDGSYVMTGNTYDYEQGDFFLLKTNNAGSTTWFKVYSVTYPDKKPTEVTALATTADGGFIMAGHVSGVFSYDNVLVIKTDSLGNVQWHKVFGGQGSSAATAVKQTAAGDYIVLGTTTGLGNAAAYFPSLYALKLSATGDSLWTRTYNYSTGSVAEAADVQLASDGNYVIGGTIFKDLDSSYADRLPVLLKINAANGNIIWSKSFGSAQLNPFNERMYNFATAPDGGFVLTGEAYVKYGYTDGFMMKVDAGGNTIQWAKRYFTSDTSENEDFEAIAATNSGYAVCGDAFSYKTSKQFGLAVATDINGNVSWANHTGNGNNNYSYSVIPTQDNGYLFSGYEIADFNFQSTTGYVLKADANGSTGCYQSAINLSVTNEDYTVGVGPAAYSGGGSIGGETISVSDAVLPVTMLCENPAPQLEFTAFNNKKSDNNNLLSWRTKSELKSDKYFVQRSQDKSFFTALGEVDASYKTLSKNPYTFADKKPAKGMNYYRIKGLSKNGRVTYSRVIPVINGNTIQVSNTNTPGVILFESNALINESPVAYSIFNSVGNKVYNGILQNSNGKIFTTVNLSALNDGIYYVHINNSEDVATQQIIISH